MTHPGARHVREAAPDRLADFCKMVGDFHHLRIVAEQQTAITFQVFLGEIFVGAVAVGDDLMPTLHERCRVIGPDIAADEKQDFHLGSSA